MTTTIQWSVDCEGEELSAWSHQRPAWCAISIAVVADDRESAWQKVAANGWQRVTHEVPHYEVCPGCMKALLEAGTARWMTSDGEKQLVLREPWVARAAGNSQREICQVMAATAMITDLAGPKECGSPYANYLKFLGCCRHVDNEMALSATRSDVRDFNHVRSSGVHPLALRDE